MKDTELFDAIAHIDDDLIDRCLADGNVVTTDTSEEDADELITVQEIKPGSTRRRIFAAIASIAAALLLAYGLISILHIGGKKPVPVEPDNTETPAPTEELTPEPTAEPTAGPTVEPTELAPLGPEAAYLREFLETADENGVKNGDKLFPNYDPNDPSSWEDEDPYHYKSAVPDEQGRIASIHIECADGAPVKLAGSLDINRFETLHACRLYNVIIDEIHADDLHTASNMKLQELTFPYVNGEAVFRGAYSDRLRMLSATHTFVDMTGDSSAATYTLPGFSIDITVKGSGYAGVSCCSDENCYEVYLVAEPKGSASFIGWYDELGNFLSKELCYVLYGEDSEFRCEGKHKEHVITARFDADISSYDTYEYNVLRSFFSQPVRDDTDWTIGEDCFYDPYAEVKYDIDDPSTWHDNYHGVYWDETGHVTEISIYPSYLRLHAELDLTGFEKLQKIYLVYVTLDKLTIADCPMLTDGCFVDTGNAAGEAHVEAGFVDKLNVSSDTHVYCSLLSNTGEPFTLDLTAEGNGRVRASSALYEGKYRVTVSALSNSYIDFLGWYDENGNLVTTETYINLTGEDYTEPISGDHKYTARFAQPPAPTPLPEGDYFCELKPNTTSYIDIDGDGEEDTVLVSINSSEDDWNNIVVTVIRAADPENVIYLMEEAGGCVCAAVVDFDTTDGHRELIVTYDSGDNDPMTSVFWWNAELSGFNEWRDAIEVELSDNGGSWYYHGIPEGYSFDAEKGFAFCKRTEILGTHFVGNRFVLRDGRVEFLSDEFTYRYTVELKLKKDLTVTLENGKTKTVAKGSKITAYSTDRETYVKVKLEDGSIGRVEVTFGDNDMMYPVLLNGVRQDEYAKMPYAD